MIILLFIFCVSVATGYEVIAGCVPSLTPVNATHGRIEYEHCFKDLNPNHKAHLMIFQDQNSTEGDNPFNSIIDGENNVVNLLSVCRKYEHVFLHVDGGLKEPDLNFSYTPNDIKNTIQDYMCYSENQVTLNMTQFRKERPDQDCLRFVKVRGGILGRFTQIRDGVQLIPVEDELEMRIKQENVPGLSTLRLKKTTLIECTDNDLVFNIIVGSSITLLFVICIVFLVYCFITTKKLKSAEIDINSDYGNNDYYIETKATDSNSYYYSNDQEDISYAKERNPEYNKSDDEE